MRTQALLDETTPSALCPKWQALEPPDIAIVEEHVANCNNALVDFVRMTGQDDAFGDDTVGGGWEGCSCRDQAQRGGVVRRRCCAGEVEEGNVAPGQRTDEGSNGRLARMQEAREFMHVVWCVAGMREELVAISMMR